MALGHLDGKFTTSLAASYRRKIKIEKSVKI
jgi:hypothetical protein